MSFILDALKKLEREKKTLEPGVVMVGPVPWGERDRSRRRRWLALGGAALAVALGASVFWLRSEADPPAAREGDQESTAVVVPAPGDEIAPAPGEPIDRPGPEAAPPPPRSVLLPGAAAPPPVAGTTARSGPAATAEGDIPATGEGPLVAPGEAEPGGSVVGAEPEAVVGQAGPEALIEEAEPVAASPPAPEYRLTAISSRDGRPIALLNDRLVREGDRFGDVLVVRIGESEVEIEVEGERRTIGF